MYLLVCNFLTRRPACPVSEPKPSDAKRVIMNITHLKGRWRITVEKGIDSIGLNVWGTRRERRFIAASYSKISHEVSRVCAAIKNVWILPADIAVPFVSCSLLFWSLVFFFFFRACSAIILCDAAWRHQLVRERQSVYEYFSQCLDVKRQSNLYLITQFLLGKWVGVVEPSHLLLHCGRKKCVTHLCFCLVLTFRGFQGLYALFSARARHVCASLWMNGISNLTVYTCYRNVSLQ